MSQLKEQLKSLVAEVIEVEENEFSDDTHLSEELGIDSMMYIEILARIEKAFKVKVPEEALPDMTSINQMYDVVKVLIDGQSEAAATGEQQ